jgi:hypothetical protein
MAIKGKGKTRSRRAVSPAPRPQIVARKKPLLMRVTTWIVVGVLVLVSVGWGVWVWWDHKQQSDLKAKETAALSVLAQRVHDQLPADQQTPQGTSQILVFPNLIQSLDQLDQGTLSPDKAKQQAQAVVDAAAKSQSGIQKIALGSIIKDDFTVGVTTALTAKGMTSSVLNEAQDQMIKSFQLYQAVGNLMKAAAEQPKGPQRTAILDQAKKTAAVAAELFNRGYNTIVQIETILGLIPISGLQPSPAG